MSYKSLTNWLGSMTCLFAGGFLALATFAFAAGTAAGLGFAVSIGVAALGSTMVGLAFAHGEKLVYGALSAAITLIAGWTIVATSVFASGTARWLVFASALGYVGVSTIALAIREVTTERVVHHLEVGERERVEQTAGQR